MEHGQGGEANGKTDFPGLPNLEFSTRARGRGYSYFMRGRVDSEADVGGGLMVNPCLRGDRQGVAAGS